MSTMSKFGLNIRQSFPLKTERQFDVYDRAAWMNIKGEQGEERTLKWLFMYLVSKFKSIIYYCYAILGNTANVLFTLSLEFLSGIIRRKEEGGNRYNFYSLS